jgi:hypothetical protein
MGHSLHFCLCCSPKAARLTGVCSRNHNIVPFSLHSKSLCFLKDSTEVLQCRDLTNLSVTICRNFCHVCIHLAVLFICDVRILYEIEWSAMTGWDYVTIYGMIASCVYYTHRVVVYDMCRIVMVLQLSPQRSGQPAWTLSTSSRSSSSCNSNTGSSSASESALQAVTLDTLDQQTTWVLAACRAVRQEQHDKSTFLAQLAEVL